MGLLDAQRRHMERAREKEEARENKGTWHGFLVIALLALAVALFGPVSLMNVSAIVATIAGLLWLAGFWRQGVVDMIREGTSQPKK